tara:strand:- start:335 stop:520 length:186 start_codon:yes stop_codon:yes gene_type:complete
LKGREVNPILGSRIILYSYCISFKVSPLEAYNTPADIILNMLAIHTEAKRLEQEELEKMNK